MTKELTGLLGYKVTKEMKGPDWAHATSYEVTVRVLCQQYEVIGELNGIPIRYLEWVEVEDISNDYNPEHYTTEKPEGYISGFEVEA